MQSLLRLTLITMLVAVPRVLAANCCGNQLQHASCAARQGLSFADNALGNNKKHFDSFDAAHPPPSAIFTFPPLDPETRNWMWAHVHCPDRESNSWYVNGKVWEVYPWAEWQWVEFGPVESNMVQFSARSTNCLINAVYIGDLYPGLFDIPCVAGPPIPVFDSATEIKKTATAASTARAKTTCSSDCCEGSMQNVFCGKASDLALEDDHYVNRAYSHPLYRQDLPQVSMDFPRADVSDPTTALWAELRCPSDTQNSWWVNGKRWNVPVSTTWQWRKFGPVDSNTVKFSVAEEGCELRSAYLGPAHPADTVQEFSVRCGACTKRPDPAQLLDAAPAVKTAAKAMVDCCGSEFQPASCASRFRINFNSDYTYIFKNDEVTHTASAVFDFPEASQGYLWAEVMCPDPTSRKWIINDTEFDFPVSDDWTWVEVGEMDSRSVKFQGQDADCKVRSVYLGQDHPGLVGYHVDLCGNL